MKDAWDIPVLKFNYKFGENEKKMCEDMARTGREMFEAAKFEILSSSDKMLTEGWSIHEMGTSRMGNDPKTSVVNQFQQSHDVKNLFVVDGSTHVNASCSESDLDDYGSVLALLRSPGRSVEERRSVMTSELNRRELIQLLSAAALSAPLALPAPDPGAPLYFSKDEYALLDTLTELIIPADDHSPGAHDAGVAAYIDKNRSRRRSCPRIKHPGERALPRSISFLVNV